MDEKAKSSEFKCQQCAAKLTYVAGTEVLKCSYCDFENHIPRSEEDIVELDFHEYLKQAQDKEVTEERLVVNCSSCGAQSTSEANITAQSCPFCDSEIISTASSVKLLKPKSLLPFKVNKNESIDHYKTWVKKLWFAPNKLKQLSTISSKLTGMYMPHWTYDSNTISFYTGQRGDHYYVTVKRDGKMVKEQRTRWRSTSGTVCDNFDDVLVVASESLPRKYTQALEPWDLENLVPYKDEYLSGFKAESYQVDLEKGFGFAKTIMTEKIRRSVKNQIGGDDQRITSLKTQHNNIKFKHILLPVWMSAYRYKEKVYRFMVNARTGEVQGERPWSWVKIGLAVTTGLVVIGGGVILFIINNNGTV
ncbi:MAG: hypothetical protein HRU38_26195 [Saccharospirillaceae bacterium]|nr:hypothetical protein [Saccharospirillaceae bacterium]